MKRKIALLVCMATLLSLGFVGCKKQQPNNDVPTTETSQPAPSGETEQRKDIVPNEMQALACYPAPNYEYQLYLSDDVIVGEVIEELESFYTNPDGDDNGMINAWITPYVIKIEKAYKGLLKEGETVVVSAWNDIGVRPEERGKLEYGTTQRYFYLQKELRSVFMLKDSESLKTDDGQPMYEVVYQNEGVFTPKETGIATMSEEAKTVYASPSFEITLDQIPADIQKADQHYGSNASESK